MSSFGRSFSRHTGHRRRRTLAGKAVMAVWGISVLLQVTEWSMFLVIDVTAAAYWRLWVNF